MPDNTAGPSVSIRSRALGNPGVGFILALTVIALDQYTKIWASNELVYRVPVEITSWFDLMLVHNTGAAFSFLASAGGWQRWFLAAVAMLVSVFVAGWLTRLESQQRVLGVSL